MTTTVAAGNPAWLEDHEGMALANTDEYDADLQLEAATIEGSATVAILRLRFRGAEAGTELTSGDLYALRGVLQGLIDGLPARYAGDPGLYR